MSDSKYFQRGKAGDLQNQFESLIEKNDLKYKARKSILKKVIANMTMGNDMVLVAKNVVSMIKIPDVEIKKMVYLYIVTYSRLRPEIALSVLQAFIVDTKNTNPLIRAMAIRTMTSINSEEFVRAVEEPIRRAVVDTDPYVCKTAAISIAKLFTYDQTFVIKSGLLDLLKTLIKHDNATVVSNSIAALMDIATISDEFEIVVDYTTVNRLLSVLDECSEWCQVSILDAVITYIPQFSELELLADRIAPRLQHSNSAVVMATVRILVHFSNFLNDGEAMSKMVGRCGPALVTLLNSTPEIQYVALRHIKLLLQKHSTFLTDARVFFCKYSDPIYIKITKLDILSRLASENNYEIVLTELKEKAIKAIGRLAIKIEQSAAKCIECLSEMIQTKIDYIVQETVIVIRDVMRIYPGKFEFVIDLLCASLDSIQEPDAKAAIVWIVGECSPKFKNSAEILSEYLDNFQEETPQVQLSLLTAIVKLFIENPVVGQKLIPRILKLVTEEIDNPDLRDRGFMYWRLLSNNPVGARAILFSRSAQILVESDEINPAMLARYLYHFSMLSTLNHRAGKTSKALDIKILDLHTRACILIKSVADPKVSESVQVPLAIDQNKFIEQQMTNSFQMPSSYQYDEYQPKIDPQLKTNTYLYGDLPLDLFSNTPIRYDSPATDINLYDLYDSPTSTGNTQAFEDKIYTPFRQTDDLPHISHISKYNPFHNNSIPIQNPEPTIYNPFVVPTNNFGLNPIIPKPLNSSFKAVEQDYSKNIYLDNSKDKTFERNENITIDPFAANRLSAPVEKFNQISIEKKYVISNILLLSPDIGRGLEILGSCIIILISLFM